MRIQVGKAGGFLGLDVRTDIADGVLQTVDRGTVTKAASPLEPSVRSELEALAAAVCGLAAPVAGASPPSDDLVTTVDIDGGGATTHLEFSSGAEVPAPVAELLAAVDKAARG